MQSQAPPRMTVETFLAWAADRPGRYDLVGGEVFAQAAERAAHRRIKFNVQRALFNAVRAKALPCHVEPDGATVPIDKETAYEPDAMVYCGAEVAPSSLIVENPVVVVEVLSPSTGRNDASRKLAGYFRLPSVRHYLIVDPDEPLVIHHERREDGTIVAHIIREGAIVMTPPGIEVKLADIDEAGV